MREFEPPLGQFFPPFFCIILLHTLIPRYPTKTRVLGVHMYLIWEMNALSPLREDAVPMDARVYKQQQFPP